MDRLAIQKQVRVLLGYGQTETAPHGNTKVNDQINNVLPEVALDFGELHTWRDYSTVASQQAYALPRDFMEFDRAYFHDSGGNRHEDLYLCTTNEEFEDLTYTRSSEEGEPTIILLERGAVLNTDSSQIPGDFCLHPIPDAVYTIRFHYYQMPDNLTGDTQIPELPEYTHMAIALKAAEYMAMAEGQHVLSDRLHQRYNDRMFLARKHAKRGQRNRPLKIKDSMGYGFRGRFHRKIRGRW